MLINKENLRTFGLSAKTNFQKGLEGGSDLLFYDMVATTVPSTGAVNLYPFLDQFPSMRKWLGDRLARRLGAHEYAIKNDDYEATVEVRRNDLEDDNLALYPAMFRGAGRSAAELPNRLIADVMKAGFTTGLGYDKVPFFGDHEEDGATVSNLVSGGSGSPWFLVDASKELKPFIFQDRRKPEIERVDAADSEPVFQRGVMQYGIWRRCAAGYGFWQLAYASKNTLDATAFDAMYAAMLERKNDEGQPLGIRPTHLVCAPDRRAAARALLKAERDAAGASNTNFQSVELVVTPWLA